MVTQNVSAADADSLLGNGWIMGIGSDNCLMAWGRPKKAKQPLRDRIQFYIPDFYLENKMPWVTFEKTAFVNKSQLIDFLEPLAKQYRLSLTFNEPKFEDFTNHFEQIKNKINSGDIEKAVPVVFATANCSMTKAMRAHSLVSVLKSVGSKVTPYAYFQPTEGIMGATPEILFSYDSGSGTLETMALAGTRESVKNKTYPLTNDEKEMFEHQIVVKGLREKLSGLGELNESPTYVCDLGLLCHLKTDIVLDTKTKNNKFSAEVINKVTEPSDFFIKMSEILHPTAALGVYPLHKDWKILKSFDGTMSRGRFGAPFGFLNPEGISKAVVAIRNIQWNEDLISIGTGCGLVKNSVLDSEWNELNLKRSSVFKLLNIEYSK
jgi:menaquinone-specific isochorismate synthase